MEKRDKVVYIYKDYDGKPFYVGMGTMKRAYDIDPKGRSAEFLHKYNKICKDSDTPIYPDIVGMYLTKQEALDLESELIDAIGLDELTNINLGINKNRPKPEPVRPFRRLKPTNNNNIRLNIKTKLYHVFHKGIFKGKSSTFEGAECILSMCG